MSEGQANGVPSSERLSPVYRQITDESRFAGNAPPLDEAKRQIERLYDLFVAQYPRGRGAEFILMAEVRRPGQ